MGKPLKLSFFIHPIKSGEYDFTLNQYIMRAHFLPHIVYTQPSKPGKLMVITKNERKVSALRSVHTLLGTQIVIGRVYSDDNNRGFFST